jgi:ribosomal protein L32
MAKPMKVKCNKCGAIVRADKLCSNCYQPLKDEPKPIKPLYYKPFQHNNHRESDEEWLKWICNNYPEHYFTCKSHIDVVKIK